MVPKIVLKFLDWRAFLKNKNKLPTTSNIINTKMEYEGLSGAIYWEDEGLSKLNHIFLDAFKHVIHHRMKLIVGPDNDVGFLSSKKFDQKIFQMAKRYFPNWIGFEEARCSYNPELTDRIMRLKKVSDWRIQKLLNEDDKRFYPDKD